MAVEQFAAEPQRAHGVVGGVAAGGVGQVRELGRRQRVEQGRLVAFWPMLVRRIATVTIWAPDASIGVARLREVAVLAGADEQARAIGAAGDDQRVVQCRWSGRRVHAQNFTPPARTRFGV